MKTPRVITIDFETAGIEPPPNYPPKPVGVSILWPGKRKSRYYAWGHPVGNNSTYQEAKLALKECWDQTEYGLLFHNAKFDLDVAEAHMGMRPTPWDRIHDTLFLLFLHNPHSRSLSLKPASEELLGMPPEEQDAVRQWLIDQGIVKKTQKNWGAYISQAPGDLVGKYADGDVIRTYKLFNMLYKDIARRSMLPAYDRERQLLPILRENEQAGIRTNQRRLARDVKTYREDRERVDEWVRKRLDSPGMNLDSNEELADGLEKAGVVTEFVYTKTGKRSVSKENLTLDMYTDPTVAAAVGYRNALTTCLSMFMEPWLAQAQKTGGYIYTSWNQVRQAHGFDNFGGARTGRMSSTPPLLNLSKQFPDNISTIALPVGKNSVLTPKPLPLVRRYLLPDDANSAWLRRDYNQQEYRIFGHYEDGSLLQAYQENPRLDMHDWMQGMLFQLLGLELSRADTKIVNFSDLYGVGVGRLAERLKTDVATIRRIRAAKRKLMTGLQDLEQNLKMLARSNQPIRTWGGREYYVEPPTWNGKRWQTYEYKLINYLIQGSAADCTKEAIIRYHQVKKEGRFLVAVHDELNLSVPKKALREESLILRDVMKSVEFDVLMLSDGEAGPNWADLKPLKEED